MRRYKADGLTSRAVSAVTVTASTTPATNALNCVSVYANVRRIVCTYELVVVDAPGDALARVEFGAETDRSVDLAVGGLSDSGPNS